MKTREKSVSSGLPAEKEVALVKYLCEVVAVPTTTAGSVARQLWESSAQLLAEILWNTSTLDMKNKVGGRKNGKRAQPNNPAFLFRILHLSGVGIPSGRTFDSRDGRVHRRPNVRH